MQQTFCVLSKIGTACQVSALALTVAHVAYPVYSIYRIYNEQYWKTYRKSAQNDHKVLQKV